MISNIVVCKSVVNSAIIGILIEISHQNNPIWLLLVATGETGTRNSGFEYLQYHGEMGSRQVIQGMSSLFAKIMSYLMIFQSSAVPSVCSTLKNHQTWQFFFKKMKKSLAQLAFNPFLHNTVSTQNPGFGYPFCYQLLYACLVFLRCLYQICMPINAIKQKAFLCWRPAAAREELSSLLLSESSLSNAIVVHRGLHFVMVKVLWPSLTFHSPRHEANRD